MSLGDIFRKVSTGGASAYNNARGRILGEKKAHDKTMEGREVDMLRQEISRRRLDRLRIDGEISRVRRELIRLQTGPKDHSTLSLIRTTESQIRTLEAESRNIDSDIRIKTAEVQRYGGMSF